MIIVIVSLLMNEEDEEKTLALEVQVEGEAVLEAIYFGERLGYLSSYQMSPQLHHQSCLSINSTIHDSTGLRVYAGCHVMIRFLVTYGDELVRGKRVIEIGSGVGLLGLVGMSLTEPRMLVCTDGELEALCIIDKNIGILYRDEPLRRKSTCSRQLLWGDEQMIADVLISPSSSSPCDPGSTSSCSRAFDVVIGCELMYYRTDIQSLVDTVLKLTVEGGMFVHGHLFRAPNQEQHLIQCLRVLGWDTMEVPVSEFIDAAELGHHIEWYRVRCLVSAPSAVVSRLLASHSSWFVFEATSSHDAYGGHNDTHDEGDELHALFNIT